MGARSRVEACIKPTQALHKCCSTTVRSKEVEAGNSPVIGERIILGAYYAYNLRIRRHKDVAKVASCCYCRRGQTSKDETKGVGPAAHSDVLLLIHTRTLLDSVALGFLVIASVSLKRIGYGLSGWSWGQCNLSD